MVTHWGIGSFLFDIPWPHAADYKGVVLLEILCAAVGEA
jgi:hypothetical protein